MEPKQLISLIGNNLSMRLRRNNGLNGGTRDIDMRDKDKINKNRRLRRRNKKKKIRKRINDSPINIIKYYKILSYYEMKWYYDLNS